MSTIHTVPWETSNRRSELPENWYTEIRSRILLRDNHRCVWRRTGRLCGQPANQVDHIFRGNDHSDENLQSLCGYHHRWKTNQESAESRRVIAAKSKHPVEKAPGML